MQCDRSASAAHVGLPQRWVVVDQVGHAFDGGRGNPPLGVLDGVSLHVDRGELVAIVGPSGCGKSTLLNVVAGLIAPAAGRVTVGGRDVSGITGHAAFMMQRDLLLPWRTVLGNVTLGMELAGIAPSVARASAMQLLERFGLAGFEHYYPSALSGGMRQRVAFMRTVACKRELLLLDEPFSGLDALTRTLLHDWLLQLWDELDLTILFITHDPDEAIYLSDRMYVLSRRPSTVSDVIDVGLPRPRGRHVHGSPEFVQLRGQVLDSLWKDVDESSPAPLAGRTDGLG